MKTSSHLLKGVISLWQRDIWLHWHRHAVAYESSPSPGSILSTSLYFEVHACVLVLPASPGLPPPISPAVAILIMVSYSLVVIPSPPSYLRHV